MEIRYGALPFQRDATTQARFRRALKPGLEKYRINFCFRKIPEVRGGQQSGTILPDNGSCKISGKFYGPSLLLVENY